MGVSVVVSRHVVNTTTGEQSFTNADLGGLTPKAAMFIVTRGTADGTAADHAAMGIGCVGGGTDLWSTRSYAKHGVTTTATNGAYFNVAMSIYDPVAGGADASANFVGFITDGVTLNWINAPDNAYLMTVILFAGTDLLVSVGVSTVSSAQDVATDITYPGFTPDLIIAVHASTGLRHSLGFVHHSGGTVTQYCHLPVSRNGRTTTEEYDVVRNDSGSGRLLVSGAAEFHHEFGDFDASGFSITPRNDAGAGNVEWLALNFGGVVDSWVGLHTTPTSTGNVSVTTPGFEPQFIMQLQTLAEAANTIYSDGRAGSYAIAAGDATEQYSNSNTRQDNVTTTNTQSISDNILVNLPSHDGSATLTGTLVSFDSTGWTTNYSAVNSVANLFPTLVIGVEGGGPTTYNDSVTLAATAAASAASNVTAQNAVSLAATAATQQSSGLIASDSLALAAVATTQQSGALTVSDSVTLAATAAANTASNVAAQDAVSLDATAAVDAAGTLTVQDAVNLAATATASTTGALSAQDAVSLDTIAALDVAGGLTLQSAVSLDATAAISAADLLILRDEVSLSASAGIAQSSGLVASEILTLDATVTASTSSGLVAQDAINLAIEAAIQQSSGAAVINESLTLGATAATQQSGGLVITEDLALDVAATVQQAVSFVLSAQLNLAVNVVVMVQPMLAVQDTVTLSVLATVAAVGEGGEAEVPVLIVYSADIEVRFVAVESVEMRLAASDSIAVRFVASEGVEI